MRTEENHLARRIIQYESMTNTPEEIGERIVELLPRLRRFARSLSRNQHDADDLVQSGVERAWRHLGQFKPGANLASWMFGIMKNAWIDNLRTRRRRGEVALPEDSGEHPAVSPVDTNTELWSVSEAMNKLPEEQRLAIALVLVEGLSYKEAAEVLEIPMGTLTSRLARGRTALAAALDRQRKSTVNYGDEILMAYVDGELDAKLRAEIAAAIENDPALARRVEQQRVLRDKVAGAFAKVLSASGSRPAHACRAGRAVAGNVLQFPARTGTRARCALACTRVGGDGREPPAGRADLLADCWRPVTARPSSRAKTRWWRMANSRAHSTSSLPASSAGKSRY